LPGQAPKEIRILSHSGLYYWWPVWAIGFILGGLSWFDSYAMFILPSDSKVARQEVKVPVPGANDKPEERDIVILPPRDKMHNIRLVDQHNKNSFIAPTIRHVTHNASYGVIFATVLMLVIVITNVPLRGMWSLLVIVTIAMLIVIISLIPDGWATLFEFISPLDIRINAGGYFFVSSILCLIWCLTVMMFDRQIYMVFSAGQLKVCTEIGDGEKIYDTAGLAVEKQKTDFFRHIILGLGSGDIIVKTSGAHEHQFEMQNVLWVGSRLAQIERLVKQKSVVAKT
jgi:hypothetical protein